MPRRANRAEKSVCLERFGFLGVIDISDTFRDVWEAVPYYLVKTKNIQIVFNIKSSLILISVGNGLDRSADLQANS